MYVLYVQELSKVKIFCDVVVIRICADFMFNTSNACTFHIYNVRKSEQTVCNNIEFIPHWTFLINFRRFKPGF